MCGSDSSDKAIGGNQRPSQWNRQLVCRSPVEERGIASSAAVCHAPGGATYTTIKQYSPQGREGQSKGRWLVAALYADSAL